MEKVAASRELIIQNRQMVALDLDLPLPLPIEDMKVRPRYPELIEMLRHCEFRSLTAEVEREAKLTPHPHPPSPVSHASAQGELFP